MEIVSLLVVVRLCISTLHRPCGVRASYIVSYFFVYQAPPKWTLKSFIEVLDFCEYLISMVQTCIKFSLVTNL
ncbi:hypothetical protein Lalb_Chr24g0396701 [Lupinus albus]|uniref:Secreted protein n=1 Tax=Lupinus albus TaxID=3870 RepID=A0A6A4N355_LUPAL|nr:hypothetical protein Lalb_Chr24g0396701 [Lupinus albus]